MNAKVDPDASKVLALINEYLEYNEFEGRFYWKKGNGFNRHLDGKLAGCNKDGYRVIRLGDALYKEHRLVWLMFKGEWPTRALDHANGNRSDNWIWNLREATNADNMRNVGAKKSNTSGYKGVSWSNLMGKWRAYIRINGRHTHLGVFENKIDAAKTYDEAARQHHGEFARLNFPLGAS